MSYWQATLILKTDCQNREVSDSFVTVSPFLLHHSEAMARDRNDFMAA